MMTAEDRKFLSRINKYAESVMADIDPQKVQVSSQLEKLRPVMEEMAAEQGLPLEELFIRYMDLQSEAACLSNDKLREGLEDICSDDMEHPFLFR